ncbi:hypothetical protein [Streptomyces avidinii]
MSGRAKLTRAQTPATQPSAPAPLPSQSAVQPSTAPTGTPECPPALKKLGECGPVTPAQSAGPDDGLSVTTVLGWAALVVAVLGLPLLPLLWRTRLRARRLATGEVLTAWRELGDAAWDVGVAPDEALSPRRAASRIVDLGRLDPEPAAAVHRVAGAVERALYAPPGAEVSYPELAQDVLLARTGLLESADRLPRLRALLLPRSATRISWALSARWATVAGAVSTRLASLRSRLPLRSRG